MKSVCMGIACMCEGRESKAEEEEGAEGGDDVVCQQGDRLQ